MQVDSKSRLAYALYLDLNSGTICARSIKSNTVSRNTADAELKALELTTVQTALLGGFLKELEFEQLEPTIIYVGHAVVELNNIKQRVMTNENTF
jgi:hypothetical protein